MVISDIMLMRTSYFLRRHAAGHPPTSGWRRHGWVKAVVPCRHGWVKAVVPCKRGRAATVASGHAVPTLVPKREKLASQTQPRRVAYWGRALAPSVRLLTVAISLRLSLLQATLQAASSGGASLKPPSSRGSSGQHGTSMFELCLNGVRVRNAAWPVRARRVAESGVSVVMVPPASADPPVCPLRAQELGCKLWVSGCAK
eukprot:190043-Chlamydomonas_euryale.AAC.4